MNVFSDISFWWSIPWLIVSIAISVFYYTKQRQLEEARRVLKLSLIGLRAISLFLIGILLFGLIFERKEYKTEKPVFITLIDNSSSMLNYKDSATVQKSINSYKSELLEKFGDQFDFEEFCIGSQISDSLYSLSESESNFDLGFDFLYNQFYNRNIAGICFISDGNFNVGRNPIYSAEKISLTPVFSLGVGDTILKKDQLIRNLAVNDIAFLNNQFPLEIDIEAHKMGAVSSKVSVFSGGKLVASEEIQYTDGVIDAKHITLLLNANNVGFVNYTVKVEHLNQESSYENNERSFYVEVIDSRNKILILAQSPHPDITAIRQVMARDENTEVDSKLFGDWKGSFEGYAMVVLHDVDQGSIEKVKTELRNRDIAALYMFSSKTSNSIIKQLNLGANYPNSNQLDEVQGYVNNSFQLFEVSEDLKKAIQNWPPLTVRFGNIDFSNGNAMISQRIGQVNKKDPVLFFGNNSGKKYGVFIGEGLWRWKLSEFSKSTSNNNFNELIQSTVQYLTVKKNTEPLRINLPKRFNVRDEITINAEFYNSSFKRITTPDITFVVRDEDNVDIKYQFGKKEFDYILELGKLAKGKYTWTASTKHDGKTYTKSGTIIIDDVSLEALSTHADHNLLSQISAKTNGEFFELKKYKDLFNSIEGRKDIASITYEESNFDELIDWKWFFFIIILFLTLEWFIRRYIGSY